MNSPLLADAPDTDYPLPESLCYLNGQFGRVCDTQISVMDRGFIFGDGVYEVLPAYDSQVFCFEEHMARLDRSLAELRIPNPLSARRMASDCPAPDRRSAPDHGREPTSSSTSR